MQFPLTTPVIEQVGRVASCSHCSLSCIIVVTRFGDEPTYGLNSSQTSVLSPHWDGDFYVISTVTNRPRQSCRQTTAECVLSEWGL
ncbi:hypothetical protein Q8A67_013669 [Cirrhinus molitorella]|uniref:Uncharacterized protein n=1 Tax=Cirrhinus molitorella TaxID=172907 RepID=A0AA88TM01_9TELE|nr:hypothetical protein Q8A67_013669 [Cirrhinus molitorella]